MGYIVFDSTGNKDVDSLLSTIALAGKAFHDTSQWTDEVSDMYDQKVVGEAPLDWIQNRANELAKKLNEMEKNNDK